VIFVADKLNLVTPDFSLCCQKSSIIQQQAKEGYSADCKIAWPFLLK